MITIALFSSKMILSRLIMWITKSPASHSAIGFEKDGKQYFLHAAWGGVQISERSVVLSTHTLVAEFEVLADLTDEVTLAEKRVGEAYDTIGLFGYLAVLIARDFGLGIHNPLASKSAVVCSEFIVELDVNKEIPEFKDLDPADVSPRDLFDICSSGASFRKIEQVVPPTITEVIKDKIADTVETLKK